MLYSVVCLIAATIWAVVMKKAKVNAVYSNTVLMLLFCALVAAIGLSQNYTQSLIPEATDGIGIANDVAYWIIGEGNWSTARFKSFFEMSLYVSLFLVVLYPLLLLIEKRTAKNGVTS
ncbi:hypothetical protein [Paenibacillus sp. UNC499MF]|uniref:hypothetical protein n=1 Tax=Paenibacillus sp. UNC499MF TaxID=1502751 RepID=UPI0008A092EC|nr:hypothetical protein [Paenibacillus sp. UNC499MF]SEG43462.1 hypothetical protein SAMN02799616_02939 [Paenibacillus sp. UNC499MF]